jgi:uncharacterized protein (TIGR02145 family)
MQHKRLKLCAVLLLGFGTMGLHAQKTGTFTDSRDGKVYKTVQIGNQVWMAENLAYKPSSGNYWAYDNNSANVAVYGYLYNWETAQRVCPVGWHLPNDSAEWTQLIDYLGGIDVAGGKLKETGTTHWKNPNVRANNESGFSALPGGDRNNDGVFVNVGIACIWWSATEIDADYAWAQTILYLYGSVNRLGSHKPCGYSVRCVSE